MTKLLNLPIGILVGSLALAGCDELDRVNDQVVQSTVLPGTASPVALLKLNKKAKQNGEVEFQFGLRARERRYDVVANVLGGGDATVTAQSGDDKYVLQIQAEPRVHSLKLHYTKDGVTRTLTSTETDDKELALPSVHAGVAIPTYGRPLADQGIHRELVWALATIASRPEGNELARPVGVILNRSDSIERFARAEEQKGTPAESFTAGAHRFREPPAPRQSVQEATCYGMCKEDHVSTFNSEVATALAGWPGIVVVTATGPYVKGSSKCFGTCEVESTTDGDMRDWNYAIATNNSDDCWAAGYRPPTYSKRYNMKAEAGAYATNPEGCVTDMVQDKSRIAAATVTVWGQKVLDSAAGTGDCNLGQKMFAKIDGRVVSCYHDTVNRQQTVTRTWSFEGGKCTGANKNPCME